MTDSRRKGTAGEREFASAVLDTLGVRLARRLDQCRAGGFDLAPEPGDDSAGAVLLAGYAIEVKRHRAVTPASVALWWRQAVRQSEAAGLAPLLAYRADRRPCTSSSRCTRSRRAPRPRTAPSRTWRRSTSTASRPPRAAPEHHRHRTRWRPPACRLSQAAEHSDTRLPRWLTTTRRRTARTSGSAATPRVAARTARRARRARPGQSGRGRRRRGARGAAREPDDRRRARRHGRPRDVGRCGTGRHHAARHRPGASTPTPSLPCARTWRAVLCASCWSSPGAT